MGADPPSRRSDEESAKPNSQVTVSTVMCDRPAVHTYAGGDDDADDAATAKEATRRYAIEGEVARGGLGRVLRAWDRRLGRYVVLKELLPNRARFEQRFRREVTITAELEHPAIVPVHDAGRLPSGRLFYAMREVSGDTLAQVVKGREGRAERLALLPHIVVIAEAVAYAHSRHIIHRDLKPNNVLLGPFGETVVIDWGLAKRVGSFAAEDSETSADAELTPLPDEAELTPPPAEAELTEAELTPPPEPALTEAGSVMGTPAYMPLEQARGGAVDERTDVYSIGAILYYVLSGGAPYKGRRASEILEKIEAGPPTPITEIEPDTPRELAAIVDKAMARSPEDRYPSARELAADLQRYQTGQIVGAHHYTTREILARWVRRHRASIAAVAVMLGVLAAFAVVSVREIAARGRRAEVQRARAETERAAARHRAAEVLLESARSALLRDEPLAARAALRGSLEIEDSISARALWQTLRGEPLVWKRDLGAAIYNIGFSPDGRTLAAASQDHSIYLIDVATQNIRVLRGQPDQLTSLVWAPDGRHLASGSWAGSVYIWDVRDGTSRVLEGHRAAIWALTYSPDGATLVSGSIDRDIRVWDVATGELRRVVRGHKAEVSRVIVSPDGATLVSCSSDHTVRIWDLASGAPRKTLTGHTMAVIGCDLAPDGHIASGSWDGTVRIWAPGSAGPKRVLRGHHGQVQTVVYRPDGRRIASAGADRDIIIWDPKSGEPLSRLSGDFDRVHDVDWSPDGRLLASGGNDNTVRVWKTDVAGAGEPGPGHTLPVVSVAFSPDGRLLATASYDKSVRIWDVVTGTQLKTLVGHTQRIYSVAFTHDGSRVISGSGDQTARVWDVASGAEVSRFEHRASVYAVAVSPDGSRLLTAGTDYAGHLWNLATGKRLGDLVGHTDRIYGAAWSRNGRQVATGSYDNTARVWDVASRRTRHVLRGHTDVVDGLAFSPDGTTLMSGSEDHTVRVWDLASEKGRILATAPGRVYRISLDPTGALIGASCSDAIARLIPVDGSPIRELRGHHGEVDDVVFSPDGALVASSSDDGTVRLWDTKSGRPAWRAPMLWGAGGALLTQRGWSALDESGKVAVPDTAWRRAVEERADHVETSPDGALCVLTSSGRLERWNTKRDRLVLSEPVAAGARVVAMPGACAVLSEGMVRLWSRGGPRILAEHARAITRDGDTLLVSGERTVTAFDAGGVRQAAWDGAPGVTALARVDGNLVLGFANGGVEVPTAAGATRPQVVFHDTPSSAVVAVAAGPARTVLVGYASGVVGLWDLDHGTALSSWRLHGPIAYLRRDGAVLDVATELGQHRRIDLHVYVAPYCKVLNEVWHDVPVISEGGQLVRRDTPEDHHCAAPPRQ